MLQPARRKFRKEQKGRNTGIATRGTNVSFGDFGLKAIERGRLTARQIEAARRAISRHIKRGGRIFIRIFPDKPISQKPAEVRMGTGKGNPEYYVSEIQPGKVLYELSMGRDRWQFPEFPTTLGTRPDQDSLRKLHEIILTACETDPSMRYQSAAAIHAALAQLQLAIGH